MRALVDVAEALSEYCADLNALGRYRGLGDATPIFWACWTSANLPLLRWLLDHGAVATDRDLVAALGHFQRHGEIRHPGCSS